MALSDAREAASFDARLAAAPLRGLFRFIRSTTGRHQVALSILTVVVFLLELAPLEIQRRVVNDLVDKRDWQLIVLLCGAYAGLALFHGALKLGLNVYRGWVGEGATRRLRRPSSDRR